MKKCNQQWKHPNNRGEKWKHQKSSGKKALSGSPEKNLGVFIF